MKEMTQICCLKPSLPPENAPSSEGGGFNDFFYLWSENQERSLLQPHAQPWLLAPFFSPPIPLGLPEPYEKRYLCENKYSNCSRFKKKKKKAAPWLWVGDAHHSAKPCGLQSVWFVLLADHYAGRRLLTLPAYPTCGSVVVYEAQRSFHTTQITNLTVPLSTAHLNWFLPTM